MLYVQSHILYRRDANVLSPYKLIRFDGYIVFRETTIMVMVLASAVVGLIFFEFITNCIFMKKKKKTAAVP